MPPVNYSRRLSGPVLWSVVGLLGGTMVALAPLALRINAWDTIALLVLAVITGMAVTMRVKLTVADDALQITTIGFRKAISLDAVVRVRAGPEIRVTEGAGVRALGNATGYVVPGPTVETTREQ